MSGNSFGLLYCVTSFGESHGPAYGGVVDGCPPGMELAAADIQRELDRRKPGSSRHVTQRRESDAIEILSGVYEGRTTGTAIGFLIRNEDQRSKDYSAIAEKFRPGHADYTYWQKYGIRVWTLCPAAATPMTEGLMTPGMVAQWSPDRVAPVVLYMVSALSGNRTNKTLFASGSKVMELKMVASSAVANGPDFTAQDLADAADRVFLPEQALDFNG